VAFSPDGTHIVSGSYDKYTHPLQFTYIRRGMSMLLIKLCHVPSLVGLNQ
jgi:hypothetical protein